MRLKNFSDYLMIESADLNQIALEFNQDFSDFFKQIASSGGTLKNGVIGATSFVASAISSTSASVSEGVCLASFNTASAPDLPPFIIGSTVTKGSTTVTWTAGVAGYIVATLNYSPVSAPRTLFPLNSTTPISSNVVISRNVEVSISFKVTPDPVYDVVLASINSSGVPDITVRNILFSPSSVSGDGQTINVSGSNIVSVKIDPAGYLTSSSAGLAVAAVGGGLVTLNGTQTLTNKTLTSPTINNAIFHNGSLLNSNLISVSSDIDSVIGVDHIVTKGWDSEDIVQDWINGKRGMYWEQNIKQWALVDDNGVKFDNYNFILNNSDYVPMCNTMANGVANNNNTAIFSGAENAETLSLIAHGGNSALSFVAVKSNTKAAQYAPDRQAAMRPMTIGSGTDIYVDFFKNNTDSGTPANTDDIYSVNSSTLYTSLTPLQSITFFKYSGYVIVPASLPSGGVTLRKICTDYCGTSTSYEASTTTAGTGATYSLAHDIVAWCTRQSNGGRLDQVGIISKAFGSALNYNVDVYPNPLTSGTIEVGSIDMPRNGKIFICGGSSAGAQPWAAYSNRPFRGVDTKLYFNTLIVPWQSTSTETGVSICSSISGKTVWIVTGDSSSNYVTRFYRSTDGGNNFYYVTSIQNLSINTGAGEVYVTHGGSLIYLDIASSGSPNMVIYRIKRYGSTAEIIYNTSARIYNSFYYRAW